jgi:hypothetical protein
MIIKRKCPGQPDPGHQGKGGCIDIRKFLVVKINNDLLGTFFILF